MIDYADSVASKELAGERSKAFSVSIPISQLSFALIAAFLIYMFGYQNSTIAQAKHDINMKKSKLVELETMVDNLKLQKARLFSSNEIIKQGSADGLCIADSNKIQIVH